ncbi:RBBP9/YdeN family alpha/beta hydrolase [Nitratifractor sp.]
MKLLLLHGWGGSDWPHWQAWLASEIAKGYGTVSFPLIQHPHFPHLNRWRKEVLMHLEDFRPDTVVTHSLAGTLWFHLAHEKLLPEIERLLLVAPPSLNTRLDTISSFYPCPLPEKLYAKEVTMVVSDNDPYIEVDEAKKLARHFEAELKILHDAGHINAESGYGEWPWIKEQINEE